MENEEVGEWLVELARETRAIRDVMTLMCIHLGGLSPEHASSAAEMLERIATDVRYQQTPSFVNVAMQVVAALRGQEDGFVLESLQSGPHRLDREELRRTLRVVSRDDR